MPKNLTHPTRRQMLALFGASYVCAGTARAEPMSRLEGNAFGTSWSLVGPADEDLHKLIPAIEEVFRAIDFQMSPWRLDSEISRLNSSPAGVYGVSRELAHVSGKAIELARATEGAFDPTVGPLVARWGFGPILSGGNPNWRGVTVTGNSISLSEDSLTLDLCGIAKGRALDLAVEVISSAGTENALFDLGGELKALGQHPSGRDWQVGIEPILDDGVVPAGLVLPPGMSVATSGTRAQGFRFGKQTYGHIIDPHEKGPVVGNLRSVTVLSPDATMADGWATALFAAGDSAGPLLAETHGLSALFLYDDSGKSRLTTTGSIRDYLL